MKIQNVLFIAPPSFKAVMRMLSCAFLISFSGLIGVGVAMHHMRSVEKEKNAALAAADLLALSESGAYDETQTAVYTALLESRLPGILPEYERRELIQLLHNEEKRTDVIREISGKVEDAIREEHFSSSFLRAAIYQTVFSDAGNAEKDDEAGSDFSTRAIKKTPYSGVVPASELAEHFFQLRHVFQDSGRYGGAVDSAYCGNLYTAFDSESGRMTSFAAEYAHGSPVLGRSECISKALSYLQLKHGFRDCVLLAQLSLEGNCLLQFEADGCSVFVSVREDTGQVCGYHLLP